MAHKMSIMSTRVPLAKQVYHGVSNSVLRAVTTSKGYWIFARTQYATGISTEALKYCFLRASRPPVSGVPYIYLATKAFLYLK